MNEDEDERTHQQIMEIAVEDIGMIRDVLVEGKSHWSLRKAENLKSAYQYFLQKLEAEFKITRSWANKPKTEAYANALMFFGKRVNLYYERRHIWRVPAHAKVYGLGPTTDMDIRKMSGALRRPQFDEDDDE